MLSKLTVESRYMLVTTEAQARELVKMAETPEALKGMLIFIDSNLIVSSRHSFKLTLGLVYLICQNRKWDFGIVIVKNPETKLDKRIDRQLTHSSRIVSKEWPGEFLKDGPG